MGLMRRRCEKSLSPLEEGDSFLINCLKKMKSCLGGNDVQGLSRLFAGASYGRQQRGRDWLMNKIPLPA
jgi:hypothetical protein